MLSFEMINAIGSPATLVKMTPAEFMAKYQAGESLDNIYMRAFWNDRLVRAHLPSVIDMVMALEPGDSVLFECTPDGKMVLQ